MDKILLNIADFTIQINFKKSTLMKGIFEAERRKLIQDITFYCRNFVLKSGSTKVNYTIDISFFHPDILKKNGKFYVMLYRPRGKNRIETTYLINIFEFQWLLQGALHELFSKNKALIFHASANRFGNTANLFVGKSGAGKSTIMKLLNSKYPALGDDSVIVRKIGDKISCYQTPIVEKNSWMEKTSKEYFLGKIFFLKKARYFKVKKITDKNYVMKKALEHAWLVKSFNKGGVKNILKFINSFDGFYFLYFADNEKKLINFFEREIVQNSP